MVNNDSAYDSHEEFFGEDAALVNEATVEKEPPSAIHMRQRDFHLLIAKNKKSAVWVFIVSAVCLGCALGEVGYDTSDTPEDAPVNPPWGMVPATDESTVFTWQSWFSIWVTMISLMFMINGIPPELTLLLATLIFRLFGIITDKEAWSGFESTSVLSIGVLFIVAKALENSGTIQLAVKYVLGKPKNSVLATLQLCIPVAIVSAFINDTPVVVMMLPIVEKWAQEIGIPKQKLLMPLSFSALLGGMCTLIGTSTNLVLKGLVDKDDSQDFTLDFFSMTAVGAPNALICVLYLAFGGHYLLPDGPNDGSVDESQEDDSDRSGGRYYIQYFKVGAENEGKTPMNLGVTLEPGATLVDIKTDSSLLPHELSLDERVLKRDDILVFSTTVKGLLALRTKIERSGGSAEPVSPQYSKLGSRRRHRKLYEVIVDNSCPLIGSSVIEADSLKHYEAAIFAFRPRSRGNGKRVTLQPNSDSTTVTVQEHDHTAELDIEIGDALLLEGYGDFKKKWEDSNHFMLVNSIENSQPTRNELSKDKYRKYFAGLVLITMVSLVASKALKIFDASILAAFALVAMQCITVSEGFATIKGRIILAILACYGLGKALENTHVTAAVANGATDVGKHFYSFMGDFMGSVGVLFSVFVVCSAMSCIVSNQATVILLYPIVKDMTGLEGTTIQRFVVILIMGASSSFMTPFGYQTNLMVWAPGRYSFFDYTKFGAPLTLIVGLSSAFFTRILIS